jgi:hypothetical protein
VDTEAKNETRTAAEAFVQPFMAQYLKFDPVTNEDRTAMRLHNRDTVHTAIPVPATRALITELKAKGGFQDEATPDSAAIPCGRQWVSAQFYVGPGKGDGLRRPDPDPTDDPQPLDVYAAAAG